MDSPNISPECVKQLPTPPSEQQLEASMSKDDATWLSSVPPIAVDEIMTLSAAAQRDPHPNKVNLGMGVYRTEDGQSWPLPSVSAAESLLSQSDDLQRHDYLCPEGDAEYLSLARDLLFGTESLSAKDIISIQTLSGSGANHLAAVFLSRFSYTRRVWISEQSWQNHMHMWSVTGVPISFYPYFDPDKKTFAFDAAIAKFEAEVQPGDTVVLQACAHNPTGQDPTPQQWRALAALLASKRAIPLFDCAYQGFASGDPYADAWPVRYFQSNYPHMPLVAAQSFSKTFGLYGQRAGALHFSFGNIEDQVRRNIVDNITVITRAEYSFPPRGGSTLVKTILGNPTLTKQWLADLKTMATRIRTMRVALHAALVKLQTPGSWDHIVEQIGMFSYTGLTAAETVALQEEHHIYLLKSGRISLSGLNAENVSRVAAAIDRVVRRRTGNESGQATLSKGAFGWIDAAEVDVF